MRAPTRVLWLTKGLGRGGAERLLADCARSLARDRYEVEVAYVLPWKDALRPDLEALGVRVHCLGGGRVGDLRWTLRLRRLVRDGRFDIVHTHMPVPAVAARLVLARPRPALVHTEHNVWSRYHWATRWANAVTYRRNTEVIAVSHAVARSIDPDSAPVTVIHHGVVVGDFGADLTARRVSRSALGLSESAFVVGTVANFTPKKDQRTLLRAYAELRRDHPESRLVLVGTGPLEAELKATAEALGLGDSVLFTGSRGDVAALLPAFDVFALTSLQEGLPISLVEALASGVPAVATDVGGTSEVLTHRSEGLLVASGRPDLVAAALAALADDEQWRRELGRTARRRAASLDIGAAQRRVEDVYARAAPRAS